MNAEDSMPQHALRSAFVCSLFFLATFSAGAQQPFWEQVNKVKYFNWSIAFGDSAELFMADGFTGVYRSADDGKHWQQMNQGLDRLTVYCLNTAPNGWLFAGTDDGLFRSRDGAASWERASTGLAPGAVSMLVKGDGAAVIAAGPGGLFLSTDFGDSWVNSGPKGAFYFRDVLVTQIGDMFLTTTDTLFRSTDNGHTWEPSLILSFDRLYSTFVDKWGMLHAASVLGYLYSSTDRGSTWTNKDISLIDITSPVLGPDGNLYAFVHLGGIIRSTDGGNTWLPITRSWHERVFFAGLMFDPEERLVVMDSEGGVFRVPPDSSEWERLRGGSLGYELQSARSAEGAVGEEGTIVLRFDGSDMFRSADSGLTWIPSQSRGGGSLVAGVPGHFYYVSDDSLYMSEDAAESWRSIGSPGMNLRCIVQLDNGTLLLGAENGIFRSTDDGRTWSNPSAPTDTLSVRFLERDPSGKLYALTDNLIILSSGDNGATWTRRSTSGLPGYPAGFVCGSNGRLFAFQQFGGAAVYASDDAGTSFHAIQTGIIHDGIGALVVDGKGRLLAGAQRSFDGGVALSEDQGATWRPENTGFYYFDFRGFFKPGVFDFIPAHDGRIYALTDSGLFRSSDWTLGTDSPPASRLDIGHNYPNPFHPSTTVAFTLPRRGHADVRVFNALGREVALLADGVFDAGTTRLSFNGSGLPGGVFFCRISTAEGVETLRMILTPPEAR